MDEPKPEITVVWETVRGHLARMIELIDKGQGGAIDLMPFADELLRMFRSYHQALKLQGKTSIRIEAVLRALDLGTSKSSLLRFLEREMN